MPHDPPTSTHCPISDQQHPHDQANPSIWIPLVNTQRGQWLSEATLRMSPNSEARLGFPSGAHCVCIPPQESELSTHLGMKAVTSSSENKLPVKSDVPFLSERKRAKAGCAAQESGVPTGSPGSKGQATWLQRKNLDWCRAMHC